MAVPLIGDAMLVVVTCTASFGVAELAAGEDVASWFRRVDAALYQAKAQGRNALVMAH